MVYYIKMTRIEENDMLIRKLTLAVFSAVVLFSSLMINAYATDSEKNDYASQEVISSAAVYNSAELYLDAAENAESPVTVGAFTVTGGVLDTDFSYSDNVLTVLTDVPLTISNTSTTATTDRIAVGADVSANITLDGVNIDVSSTSGYCAFAISNNSAGDVTITLSGTNILKSGSYCAGLQKNGTNGSLTIGGTGSLTATGGSYSAGIGGGYRGNASNITITDGTVNAKGGHSGAGIGGGQSGTVSNITISGGVVTATGGYEGAGIGGGLCGQASNISINGGTVTAKGCSEGAAIGAGYQGRASKITISSGSVKTDLFYIAIGGGYSSVTPTNGTSNVYLCVIDNPNGGEILIDGTPFTPTCHGSEAKVYAYLTGEDHVISVNGIAQNYCFNSLDSQFYPGKTIEDYLDYNISGGVYGEDFNFSNSVITVLTDTPLTFSGKSTSASQQRIVIAKDVCADITLNGVNIDVSSTSDACAFKIADDSAGDVKITLVGTNILKSGENCAGLQKNGTNGSLTIGGTGSLTATGGEYGSGIGSGYRKNASNITITGGTVSATGGRDSAGIGGGICGNASNITISGGIVKASGDYGEYGGAGIGGGYGDDGTSATNITISGGVVTATGGYKGAGIGGCNGYYGNGSASGIVISGGSVKAKAGKKPIGVIGGGYQYRDVTPTNGTDNVYLLIIDNPAGEAVSVDGTPYPSSHGNEAKVFAYLTGENHTVTIVGIATKYFFNPLDNLFYEGSSIDDILKFTITGGTYGTDYGFAKGVLTVYTETELTISNKEEAATDQLLAVKSNVSANITLSGVNIDATDSVKERPNYMYEDEYESEESSEAEGLAAFGIADASSGEVSITLEGTNVLKGGNEHAALEKNGANGSLTICGTGSLIATGGTGGAGIGGSEGLSTSYITISGGIVTATGDSCGAGIGGGSRGSASYITISGGTVSATGDDWAAGIGGGYSGKASYITISGGTVSATGGADGAGIGGGYRGSATNIIISRGTVNATGGNYAAGIGGGYSGKTSNITISGGDVTANGGSQGAGIGSGYNCDGIGASNITISGGVVTAKGGLYGASIGCEQNDSASKIIISGGSVKALDNSGSESISITPTNGADPVENVYLFVVENPSKRTVTIDGKEFTPNTHNDENRIYVYLTGKDHTVKVGTTTKQYTFTDGAFVDVTNSSCAANVLAHSLTLTDSIGVNFYMELSEAIVNDAGAVMEFILPNGSTTCVNVRDAKTTQINGTKCYIFSCSVAAAEMTDTITAKLYMSDGSESDEFTYSVATYANYILEHRNEEEFAKAAEVAEAMLNYGAAAQEYFRGSTEMSFTNPEVTAADLTKYMYSVIDNDSTIDFYGQVISLKSKVTAKLYFTGKTFAVSDFSVKQNGVAVDASRLTVGTDANGQYLAISGIAANEMGNAFEIMVGGVTISNYSVYSYVLGAIDSTTEGLSDVVAALYEYGIVAARYTAA